MNDRKRQVIFTAQRLFIEKGFSNTSVQDILATSNISKGTFYNYFPSKNACLMAILEYVNEETFVKRREFLIGKDISDKEVLAKQVAIRMQMNREQNLFLLFEEIFHSGDQELREYVKKSHLDELFWLTERLVDVYGKETAPYTMDLAALMLGMMQHVIHVWTATAKDVGDLQELVQFVIRRLDSIIPDMIETKDKFLNDEIYILLKNNLTRKEYSTEDITSQLEGFCAKLPAERNQSGHEYAQFLIEEIKSDQPRTYLIETITRSFTAAFSGTSDEAEARELASRIWSIVGKND
ncbi:TetR/AcrR family transcriptional regulator [Virgibacillus halodenitrificans]|uniref:TetR/AcrR family transcriptional regulator n=1 Tax=Virgibacillus halodenitrificans TaxID=1482 RepID=A0ABR7VQ96_VIRHA|nr:TetR/AcrR family transcriptional regulator [Virgibacillus halodenitrificans]MBD1224094.1 TetR/AcrR family transcriptional regulator [Virgibacillus halodenitrificans]CDQ35322.1 HTH-type transcriptional regulator EthR [Virgibacillus halodenitrificans]